MNVLKSGLILLVVSLLAFHGNAAPIDSCLSKARKMTLAIDQKQNTEYCFQAYAKELSKTKCFDRVSNLKKTDLQENLNSICFYQAQDFTDLKSCAAGANRFKLADNHDEALFDCYMQFQSQTSQKQCFEISRQLTLPHRKNHMRQHCQNNY
jgi:hypothetical protein